MTGKMIEVKGEQGITQKKLVELSGVKQLAIARVESMKSTPQIDMLFKLLSPLGYIISITPMKKTNVDK